MSRRSAKPYPHDRPASAESPELALFRRLTPRWTAINRARLTHREGASWILLCRAGLVEVKLNGEAWTDAERVRFEATAGGAWADKKQAIPQAVRAGMPAWRQQEVVAQLADEMALRLTADGERFKRLAAGEPWALMRAVVGPPCKARIAVRFTGEVRQRPSPAASTTAGCVAVEDTAGNPGSRSEPSPPLPPEGEWHPGFSLADAANRLGNVGRGKAKTILTPYGLRQSGNRQTWTVRLDAMPKNLRDKLTR